MATIEVRRRRRRTKPAINIRFEETERQMLDKQCATHRVDMTTFIRTVVVLIDNGTITLPTSVFKPAA